MAKPKKPSLPPGCLEEVRTFSSKTGGFISFFGDMKGYGLTPREAIDDLSTQIVTYRFHQPYFEKYKAFKKKS